MYRIEHNVSRVENGKFRISNVVSDNGRSHTLWFEVDAAFQGLIATDSMDAAMLSCLLPAMRSGQDLIVEGPISSKLYYNLTHSLIPILKTFLPGLHVINVIPAATHRGNSQPATGVMAGFSGGIDSFCNIYDHSGDRAPEEFQITHFVHNNVGSHGQDPSGKDRLQFNKRYNALRSCVEQLGKPFITVDSNLDEIVGME